MRGRAPSPTERIWPSSWSREATRSACSATARERTGRTMQATASTGDSMAIASGQEGLAVNGALGRGQGWAYGAGTRTWVAEEGGDGLDAGVQNPTGSGVRPVVVHAPQQELLGLGGDRLVRGSGCAGQSQRERRGYPETQARQTHQRRCTGRQERWRRCAAPECACDAAALCPEPPP